MDKVSRLKLEGRRDLSKPSSLNSPSTDRRSSAGMAGPLPATSVPLLGTLPPVRSMARIPSGRRCSNGEQLGALGSAGGSPVVQVPLSASGPTGVKGSSASRLHVVVPPPDVSLVGVGGMCMGPVTAASRNSSALSLHRMDDASSVRGLDEGRPSYCGLELLERPSDSGRSANSSNPYGGPGPGGMPPAPPVSSAHAMFHYVRGNSGLTSPGAAAMRASPGSPFQVQTVLQSVKEQLQARFLDAMAASAANNVQATSGDGQGPGWSGGGRRATTNSMFVEADTLRRAAAGAGRGGSQGHQEHAGGAGQGGRGGKRPTSETSDTSQRSSGHRESELKRPTSDAGGGFAFRTSTSGRTAAYPIAEGLTLGGMGGMKDGPAAGAGWFAASPGHSNHAGGVGGAGVGGSGRRHRAGFLGGDDLSAVGTEASSSNAFNTLPPPPTTGGQHHPHHYHHQAPSQQHYHQQAPSQQQQQQGAAPPLGSVGPQSQSRNARAPPNSTVGFDPLASIGDESSGGGAMDVDVHFGGGYRMSGGSGSGRDSGRYIGEISMSHAAPILSRDRPSAPGAYGHHSNHSMHSSGSGGAGGGGAHSPPVLRLSHTGRRSAGSSSPLALQGDPAAPSASTVATHLFLGGGSTRPLTLHSSLHGGRQSAGSSSPHSRLMSPSGAASPSRMSSSGPASPSVAGQSRLSFSGHKPTEISAANAATANAALAGGSQSSKAVQQVTVQSLGGPGSPVAMSRLGTPKQLVSPPQAWGASGAGAGSSAEGAGGPQAAQEPGPTDMQQG